MIIRRCGAQAAANSAGHASPATITRAAAGLRLPQRGSTAGGSVAWTTACAMMGHAAMRRRRVASSPQSRPGSRRTPSSWRFRQRTHRDQRREQKPPGIFRSDAETLCPAHKCARSRRLPAWPTTTPWVRRSNRGEDHISPGSATTAAEPGAPHPGRTGDEAVAAAGERILCQAPRAD